MFALLASFCLTSKPQSVPSKRISSDHPTGEITWSCSEVMHKWYQSKFPLMVFLWLSSLSNVIPVPGKIEVLVLPKYYLRRGLPKKVLFVHEYIFITILSADELLDKNG